MISNREAKLRFCKSYLFQSRQNIVLSSWKISINSWPKNKSLMYYVIARQLQQSKWRQWHARVWNLLDCGLRDSLFRSKKIINRIPILPSYSRLLQKHCLDINVFYKWIVYPSWSPLPSLLQEKVLPSGLFSPGHS